MNEGVRLFRCSQNDYESANYDGFNEHAIKENSKLLSRHYRHYPVDEVVNSKGDVKLYGCGRKDYSSKKQKDIIKHVKSENEKMDATLHFVVRIR